MNIDFSDSYFSHINLRNLCDLNDFDYLTEKQNTEESHSIKKTRWSPMEDYLLKKMVSEHGLNSWNEISIQIPGRSGKQCRERWMIHHDPNLKKEIFTHEEDQLLIYYQRLCGNKWSLISKYIEGRSATCLKNRWKFLKKNNFKPKSNKNRKAITLKPLKLPKIDENPTKFKNENEIMLFYQIFHESADEWNEV